VSGGYDQLVLVHHLDSTDLLQAGWERLRRPFSAKECQEYLQMPDCPSDYEVFIQGLKFAQIGKIDQAVAKFQELKRNPAFVSEPPDLAAHFRADYLLDRANLRVRAGEIKEGMSDFEEVKKTDPARLKFALPELFRYARLMLSRGQVEPLIEIAKYGPEFDDSFSLSADVWNDLCWYGSLWGDAQKVMFACERAVELSGGDAEYRDSKGLALALQNRFPEAIQEFKAFVASPGASRADKERRRQWLEMLQKRKNPFNIKLRRQLLFESDIAASELHYVH
jgi:tetratricopeptide (TPR) repeat protein